MRKSNPTLAIKTPDVRINIITASPIKVKIDNNQISININPKSYYTNKINQYTPIPAITTANISPKQHKHHHKRDYSDYHHLSDSYSHYKPSEGYYKDYNSYEPDYSHNKLSEFNPYSVVKPETPTFNSPYSKYSDPVYTTTMELYKPHQPSFYPNTYNYSTFSPMKRPTSSYVSNIPTTSFSYGTISNNYHNNIPSSSKLSLSSSSSSSLSDESIDKEIDEIIHPETYSTQIKSDSNKENEEEVENEVDNEAINNINHTNDSYQSLHSMTREENQNNEINPIGTTQPNYEENEEEQEIIVEEDDNDNHFYETNVESQIQPSNENEELGIENDEVVVDGELDDSNSNEFNIIDFLQNKCTIYNGDEYISYIMREWKYQSTLLHHDYLQV